MKSATLISRMLMLAVPFAFIACNDDDNGDGPGDQVDTTPPQIEVIRPEPDEVRAIREHEDSRNLHFRAQISDDVELGEAMIDIHNAFDDHGHGKNFSPFHYEHIFDLTGTKDTFIDYDVVIPNTAVPGDYHLTIYVTDKAGNSLEDDQKNIEFVITNEHFGPSFTVNSPEDGSLFQFNDELNVNIEIRGYVDLEDIWMNIVHEGSGEVVYDFHRDHLHADPYVLNRNIFISEEWPEGQYEIEIEVELENGKHYHMHPHLHFSVH